MRYRFALRKGYQCSFYTIPDFGNTTGEFGLGALARLLGLRIRLLALLEGLEFVRL